MNRHFLDNAINISLSELPRMFYGWALWFFFKFSYIIGWTTVVAVTVTYFSIIALPVIFLIQSLFTIAGMMFFSVFIDRMTARKILTLNIIFSVIFLFLAFISYQNPILFLVFTLIATGVFLPQISIILSDYLEEFFTPLEAERIFPAVDSAETIGGILGGVFLVYVAGMFGPHFPITLWIACLLVMLGLLYFLIPRMPPYLEKLDEESQEKYHPRLSWNGITKSIDQIRKTPFLQTFLLILIFHWIAAHFIEFLYTGAVEDSVHTSSAVEHEASLSHGLGALQILFHSSALVIQLFVSSRLLKSFGTFAGFVIHAFVTLLGTLSFFFGAGYWNTALIRNNFEMTGIIQKNAYESSYYAFKYGTLRSLREFFEGIIFPIGTIIGTLIIISLELFFPPSQFLLVVAVLLGVFAVGMLLFSSHLQKQYTALTVKNLGSSIPIARHHALEIISQKGHKSSYLHLKNMFHKYEDFETRHKVVLSLSRPNDPKALELLLEVLNGQETRLHCDALESVFDLGQSLRKKRASKKGLPHNVVKSLEHFIRVTQDEGLQTLAVKALAQYDIQALKKYLTHSNPVIKAEAALNLWKMKLLRQKIRNMVESLLKSHTRDGYRALAHLAGDVRIRGMMKLLKKHRKSPDVELRLLSYYALIKADKHLHIPDFIHLLLYGNAVIFQQGIQLIEYLSPLQKRNVAHALMPISQLQSLPPTREGKKIFGRISDLYEACDSHDTRTYLDTLIPCFQQA